MLVSDVVCILCLYPTQLAVRIITSPLLATLHVCHVQMSNSRAACIRMTISSSNVFFFLFLGPNAEESGTQKRYLFEKNDGE